MVLLFFGLLGNSILAYLKISFPAFTIAGGIILFVIALLQYIDVKYKQFLEDFKKTKLSKEIKLI